MDCVCPFGSTEHVEVRGLVYLFVAVMHHLQGQKEYRDHPQHLHLVRSRASLSGLLRLEFFFNIQILLPPKKVRTMKLGLNEIVQLYP